MVGDHYNQHSPLIQHLLIVLIPSQTQHLTTLYHSRPGKRLGEDVSRHSLC